MVKRRYDLDYCRDRFEDFFDEHGHVRWIEAPKWRNEANDSSGKNVWAEGNYKKSMLDQEAEVDLIESYFPTN